MTHEPDNVTVLENTVPTGEEHAPPVNAPAADVPRKTWKKRRWKLGDRGDGRKLRSLPPISLVSPYIMTHRNGSCTYFRDQLEITEIEQYIRQKRKEGYRNFGIMHVLLAAYVRTVSQRPAINRFLSGQRLFARKSIDVALTVKKEMTLESPDTCIKATFQPDDTAIDVYESINRIIQQEKSKLELDSGFDKVANLLRFVPGLLLKFVVWLLRVLDYFGLLPGFLLKISPFHASMFITSMGSLGIPPVFHHLYDFGNVPIFMAFGAKHKEYELDKDGKVIERRYVDYTMVSDERICDGFYYASALKYFKHILKDPTVLDQRPREIVEDID